MIIDPNDVNALNGKAFANTNLDKNEEALQLIKVLKSDSSNEYYLSTAAFIMYNLKKYDDAKSYFEKALKINKSYITSIMSEKELTAFHKLMNNNNTKQ